MVIDENELEVPETEIEESNLKEHEELEKQSEEVLLKLIEAEKKKEEEEKRRQNAELEMQQLKVKLSQPQHLKLYFVHLFLTVLLFYGCKAEMEKLRLENEKLKSKPEAPQLIFGNTPATQGAPGLNLSLVSVLLTFKITRREGLLHCQVPGTGAHTI